jgi:ribosome-binding protein aMBF1 (putative translation factor)
MADIKGLGEFADAMREAREARETTISPTALTPELGSTKIAIGPTEEEKAKLGKAYYKVISGIEKLKELRARKKFREAMGEAGVEIAPKPPTFGEFVRGMAKELLPPPPEKPSGRKVLEEAGVEVV